MGRKRSSGPPAGAGGGETMQLDALVDDFEEVDIPDLGSHAPPPLPPEKAGFGVWIAGGLVVLLAAGVAIGIGLYLKTSSEPAPAASAPAPPAEEPPAEESPATRIQMDDIVFGDEPAEGEPAEGAEPAASE